MQAQSETAVRMPAVAGQPVVDPATWTGSAMIKADHWIHRLTEAETRGTTVRGARRVFLNNLVGSVVDGRLRLTRSAATGTLDASYAKFASGEWATQLSLQGISAWALDRSDALGIEPPTSIKGVTQSPIEGCSFAHSFEDPSMDSRHRTQYFEMMGHRSIYHDGWRAVCPGAGAVR